MFYLFPSVMSKSTPSWSRDSILEEKHIKKLSPLHIDYLYQRITDFLSGDFDGIPKIYRKKQRDPESKENKTPILLEQTLENIYNHIYQKKKMKSSYRHPDRSYIAPNIDTEIKKKVLLMLAKIRKNPEIYQDYWDAYEKDDAFAIKWLQVLPKYMRFTVGTRALLAHVMKNYTTLFKKESIPSVDDTNGADKGNSRDEHAIDSQAIDFVAKQMTLFSWDKITESDSSQKTWHVSAYARETEDSEEQYCAWPNETFLLIDGKETDIITRADITKGNVIGKKTHEGDILPF